MCMYMLWQETSKELSSSRLPLIILICESTLQSFLKSYNGASSQSSSLIEMSN